MARIRYLKPEFFTDEELCALPYHSRLAFAGLWCFADKAGRLEDRPKYLKAMIFPYDDKIDMEKQLESLSSPKPFIQRYEVDGKNLIQIVNWEKHQRPHNTERESELPPPPAPPLNTNTMGKGMGKLTPQSLSTNNVQITVKDTLNNNHKKLFGEFKNVMLTEDEHKKLTTRLGAQKLSTEIEQLSVGIASKGYKYKSHYATIINWNRRHTQENISKNNGSIDTTKKNETFAICPNCRSETLRSRIENGKCWKCREV